MLDGVRTLLLISKAETGEKDVRQLFFSCHSYSGFTEERCALYQLYDICLNARKKR